MKIKIHLAIILALFTFSLPSTRGQTFIDLNALTEISVDNATQLQLLNTIEVLPNLRLSFNHDGKLLAAGGGSSAKIWDTQTGELVSEFERPRHEEAQLNDLAFSPTSNLIAIAWNDGLDIWNLEDDTRRFIFQSEALSVADVTFSDDGTMLI